MTTGSDRNDTSRLRHEPWCPRIGCETGAGGDIIHRETPTGAIPSLDGQHMTFSRIQCDERGRDGQQITHPPDVMVTLGDSSAVYGIAGLEAIIDSARSMVELLRDHHVATAPEASSSGSPWPAH